MKMNLELEGEQPESLQQLLEAYEQQRSFLKGKSGVFLDLRKRGLEKLGELSEEMKLEDRALKAGENSIPLYRAFYLDELAGSRGVRSRAFQELVRNGKNPRNFPVPEEISGVLRDYQKAGFQWMKQLDAMGLSGILADEMGLGKTVQILAVLLSEKGCGQPSLIICPASLIYNWEHECRKFAPGLLACPVAGTAEERREKLKIPADIYITSYDLLRRDMEQYQQIVWRFVILDEAQFIKNARTQNARCVKRLTARTRFALTGTPIENRLSELWSIFDFLMPGFLYSGRKFREHLELPILKGNQEVSGRLNRMVRPFILRRLKTQVLKDLPEKLENTVYTKLSGEQKKLYQGAALKLLETLKNQSEEEYGKERMRVLAELMRLRQICCSPQLCFPEYKGDSVKLEACMELLRSAVLEGHKVLVFSQFTTMLAIIREQIIQEGFRCFQLTGDTPKEERLRLAEEFNGLEQPAVFLISLKAGGTGLNLTGADVVVHYDPWWNLAAQDQATDRAHRIGQENKVTVFRLIARDTVEEKILALQEAKRKLAGQVLGESGIPAFALSREELLKILEETG